MQDDTDWSSLSIVSCSSQRSTCDHEILEQKVYLVLEVLNKGQQIIDKYENIPLLLLVNRLGKRNLTQTLNIWDIKKKKEGKKGRKESKGRKYTMTLWYSTNTWGCAEVVGTKGFYIILTGRWVDIAILTHNLGSRGRERSNDLKTLNHKAKLPWWLRW